MHTFDIGVETTTGYYPKLCTSSVVATFIYENQINLVLHISVILPGHWSPVRNASGMTVEMPLIIYVFLFPLFFLGASRCKVIYAMNLL